MINQVHAVMFDVFGTVVDWRSSIANEVRQIPELKDVDAECFADRWRSKYQPAMERIRRGEEPWTKLDDLHRRNLLEVLGEFEVSHIESSVIDHLNRAWHRLRPWRDSVAGLQRIKRNFIIATLSNGNVALIVNMARNAGLPWDMVLGAEVVRHYKPQPQSYLKSAEMLDLAPEQCMLTAAHNSDLIAAAGCGFKTAFVPRPTEYGPSQTADLVPERDYDIVAGDFNDLANKLGC